MKIQDLAESYFDQTVAFRRFLHKNPELAFQEVQTSAFIRTQLEESGYSVHTGFATTGLVGSFDTGKTGPRFLLRFDMDALPVEEENDFGYQSLNPGKMHACGHDGHMAIGLTIAWMIKQLQNELSGSFHLLFQPAEEIGQGAETMIRDGVLDLIKPDYVVGAHLWNEKPLGWLGIVEGPLMAGASIVNISVKGKGGHGGRPDATIDPIVTSAQLINQIQTIVSRNLDPFEPAVISIGSIHGGSAFNIIPSVVDMTGTLRYFNVETYNLIKNRLELICKNIGEASDCQIELSIEESTHATANAKAVADAMKLAAAELVGPIQIDSTYKTMMSEDMSLFLENVPGCFVLVGAGESTEGKKFSHHHPKFDFNEQSLPIAAALLLQTCVELTN